MTVFYKPPVTVDQLVERGNEVRPMSTADGLPACRYCNDEKLVANTAMQEPWSYWQLLPGQAAMAVAMGLVKAVPCPQCGGST